MCVCVRVRVCVHVCIRMWRVCHVIVMYCVEYVLTGVYFRSEAELVRKKVHEEASAKELERWESIRTTKTASTTTGLSQTQYKDPTSSGGGGGGELFSSGETIGNEPCLRRVWLEEANMMIEEVCMVNISQYHQPAPPGLSPP